MLYKKIISTPLGDMIALVSDEHLCLLEFADQKNLNNTLEKVKTKLKTDIKTKETDLLSHLKDEIKVYFAGEKMQFSTPILMLGTDFQKQAWQALQTIPYAKTISYSEQAKNLNNPSAVRAVANANSKNLISIIVPCHRVIGQNGTLTGYAGGLWRKKWLLNHENATINSGIHIL